MKTIGLIGGMSWESTVTYYQIINDKVKQALGGFHSAKILLYSVDFQEIEACQTSGDWVKSAEILGEAARRLEKAGADFLVICTNTMHKVLPELQQMVSIPFLHIAEAAAGALKAQDISKVLLLGTRYTMQQDFYKEKLRAAGIEVLIPDEAEMERINTIIFQELCLGKVLDTSRSIYQDIIGRYAGEGAQGVVLGCTEIGLLISQLDVSIPVFDTAVIHAEQAVRMSLAE